MHSVGDLEERECVCMCVAVCTLYEPREDSAWASVARSNSAHARNDVRARRRERARRASMRYAALHIIDGVVHDESRVCGQPGVWLVLCDTVHLCKRRGHDKVCDAVCTAIGEMNGVRRSRAVNEACTSDQGERPGAGQASVGVVWRRFLDAWMYHQCRQGKCMQQDAHHHP